ncbi:tRNA uridine-5-carboxymethylaminomethyl(34) synthesis GTPase MnmE [PVC group bacterium]|nr:tRNA uridine-5-carboxymethylaminomethyl(34) synthesis GTPase MnmE [PVC group bacterium]
MKISLEDTIAAIATPGGVGALAIIRVSGNRAIECVDNIFSGKTSLKKSPTHTIHYGKIFEDNQSLIDDVMVSVFHRPHSFTGENSVEITTHGNPLITQKILSKLVKNGTRLAEPGEFTKRAYLNGRMDLTQAEAVQDIITSRTEASLKGARNQLNGFLSKRVNSFREALIHMASLLELELDFVEEDISFTSPKEMDVKISGILDEIRTMCDSYAFGRVMKEGIHVALVGLPNTGKSSLLNYFLKENRAIVSDIPGTTRDTIQEELQYGGLLFHLSDTAGIRQAQDLIEEEGITRSNQAIRDADLVLFLFDAQSGFSEELYHHVQDLTDEIRMIRVMNKVDLKLECDSARDIDVSALTGDGMNELLEILKSRAISIHPYTEKSIVVTNIRHFHALEKSKTCLERARQSLEEQLSQEFIAMDLREAIQELDEIIGIVTTDDVLNNIFSKFCIGK